MIPFKITLSRAARSGLNPTPSSMNVDSLPRHQMSPRTVDSRDAFQQRALAAAVAARDAEELAALDRERDVVQGAEGLVADLAARMQRALLERMHPLLGHPECLADISRNTAPGARRGWQR